MKILKPFNSICFCIFQIGNLNFKYWKTISGDYEAKFVRFSNNEYIIYIMFWRFELSWWKNK